MITKTINRDIEVNTRDRGKAPVSFDKNKYTKGCNIIIPNQVKPMNCILFIKQN
jgi:hypothetical protein